MMVLTLLIVFVSAFVTDIIGQFWLYSLKHFADLHIGVHPIFGGFIAGLIIPHEGGFAIAVVEKIDDLVSMLFLPIVRATFLHPNISLPLITVFRPFWAPNQPRAS